MCTADCRPGLVALVDEIADVSVRGNDKLRQVLDVRTKQRMFANSQVVSVLWIEQISHVLAIYLHVAHLYHDTLCSVNTDNVMTSNKIGVH